MSPWGALDVEKTALFPDHAAPHSHCAHDFQGIQMTGQKGKSGGDRSGAGRQPKQRETTGHRYETAEEYLAAVVAGDEPPDPARIQAAKSLMSYQQPKQRAKPTSKTPTELQRQNDRSAESAARAEWREKSEAIRRRHKEKTNGNS